MLQFYRMSPDKYTYVSLTNKTTDGSLELGAHKQTVYDLVLSSKRSFGGTLSDEDVIDQFEKELQGTEAIILAFRAGDGGTDQAVGYGVLGRLTQKNMSVDMIFVQPEFQRDGVGTRIETIIEELARKGGAENLYAIIAGGEHVRQQALAHGFSPEGKSQYSPLKKML